MTIGESNKRIYNTYRSIIDNRKHDDMTIMKKCSINGLSEKEMKQVSKMVENFYK